MIMPASELRNSLQWQLARLSIIAAFGSFATANLIHNHFGLDRGILPASFCITMLLLRPRRGWLLAAALTIATPTFVFFEWPALLDPFAPAHFANHLALLVAALLAASAALFAGFDMEL